ncbi:hypothetical protein ABIE32_002454 [Comamonas sp. 4034]
MKHGVARRLALQGAGQLQGLVVAPLAQPRGRERYRKHEICLLQLLPRVRRLQHQLRHGPCPCQMLVIFELLHHAAPRRAIVHCCMAVPQRQRVEQASRADLAGAGQRQRAAVAAPCGRRRADGCAVTAQLRAGPALAHQAGAGQVLTQAVCKPGWPLLPPLPMVPTWSRNTAFAADYCHAVSFRRHLTHALTA